jgi:hypothetical protein
MVMKPGLSHQGKEADWGRCKEYLDKIMVAKREGKRPVCEMVSWIHLCEI